MRLCYGLFLVSLAACSSSTSMSSNHAAPPPAPPSAPGTVLVTVSEYRFSPDTIMISKGTPVRWTNEGTLGHSVVSDSAGVFNSSTLGTGGVDTYGMPYAGASYDMTFTTAGTYPYHCGIHPRQMRGVVIVSN
jgi:plastocyanin